MRLEPNRSLYLILSASIASTAACGFSGGSDSASDDASGDLGPTDAPADGGNDEGLGDAATADGGDVDGAISDATAADATAVDASPDGPGPADAGTGDAGDLPVDAPEPDAGDGCATAATSDWSGTASVIGRGAGSGEELRATIQWQLATRVGCVDHYRPVGTVTYLVGGNCQFVVEPASTAAYPDDGELVIDRRLSPATYEMVGTTVWHGVVRCVDEAGTPGPIGGPWAMHHGLVVGGVISGAVDQGSHRVEWTFTRDDAEFSPPATGCVGAAAPRWNSVLSVSSGTTAIVTWDHVATADCVDRYQPSGTAQLLPHPTYDCASLSGTPDSADIAATDGVLEIDRSTSPPAFHVSGGTAWSGVIACTQTNGEVLRSPGVLGGEWAIFDGFFDGDRFAGGTAVGPRDRFEWSVIRATAGSREGAAESASRATASGPAAPEPCTPWRWAGGRGS